MRTPLPNITSGVICWLGLGEEFIRRGSLQGFGESPQPALVRAPADGAVELVDFSGEPDPPARSDGVDPADGLPYLVPGERSMGPPWSSSEADEAARMRTISSPLAPEVMGVRPLRMQSRKC